MTNFKRAAALIVSIGLSSAFIAGAAQASGYTGTKADFGDQVADTAASREIALTSATKYVNVANGETVRFVVDGKPFTWHFSTLTNETAFDLSRIAPAGTAVSAHVYVAANPLYQG